MNLKEIIRNFKPLIETELPETIMTREQKWQFNVDCILGNLHEDHMLWQEDPDSPEANYFSRK